MSHILHRQISHSYPVAGTARGLMIRDGTGKEYLDASGGAAVSCLGHAHPDVLAAMHQQLDELAYAHTSFFTSQVAEDLADDLIAHAPEGLGHVFYVSGGSEAVEAALKLARQYFVERQEPQRRFIVARRQSYHGVTLGALAVGGREWQRKQFGPLLIETHHVSPAYEYRGKHAGETAETYGLRLTEELEGKIDELGGDNVIAFVAETVVGATLGAVPAVPGYFRRVREICNRHGILLILDEVMCGMGRTGTLHACEQEGISPDVMAVAKGLGGGYAPIGALLIQEKIFNTIAEGSGAFLHSHTYMGHPLACAAALAVQRVIRRDNLLENVRRHVAQSLPQGSTLRFRVMSQSRAGEDVEKVVRLTTRSGSTGVERLQRAGLSLSTVGDKVTARLVSFGSEAAKYGLTPGDEIIAVLVPADRLSRYWFALPAVLLLAAMVVMQRRRLRPKEANSFKVSKRER